MPLRIRFAYDSGRKLAYGVERLADGYCYDFAAGSFQAAPKAPTRPLPEDTGIYRGRYRDTCQPTPAAVWTDGDYCVTVFDQALLDSGGPPVVVELAATFRNGDDQVASSAAAIGPPASGKPAPSGWTPSS
jgi:hypothetical protein